MPRPLPPDGRSGLLISDASSLPPTYLIVQISDVHLTEVGTLGGQRFPRQNLVSGLATVAEAGLHPDLFLLTGDLADTGSPSCYDDLRTLMDDACDLTAASVIYLPGNHDHRDAFRTHLLGHSGGSGPINQIHWCGGLRIVLLDSSVPGEEAGALDDETLDFLQEALETPARHGTLLAVHHPPIPSPIRRMTRIMLRDPERLANVIEDSDVRLVISGHYHHEEVGTLAGVPVWVSPASAYRMDVLSRDVDRKVPGAALSLIEITPFTETVSVIPVPVGAGTPQP